MSTIASWPDGPSRSRSDPSEALDRIDQKLAELVRWVKILVGVVVVLIIVTARLFV